jgi:hypothetical protein
MNEQAAGCPPLLAVFLAGNLFRPLIDSPDRRNHRDDWRAFLRTLTSHVPSDGLRERFHTRWHECHHFLRELVDDDALLMETARSWLPRYAGPGMTLWRGENIERFESGRVGSAWTDKESTAKMFASGLNATGKGGIVLRVDVSGPAIIAGPSAHSANWLGENEYTVDVAQLEQIEHLERFDPA